MKARDMYNDARTLTGFEVSNRTVKCSAFLSFPSARAVGLGRRSFITPWRSPAGRKRSVRLEATLNAVGFYERLGFRAVRPGVVRRNDIEIPVIIRESTR